MPLLPPGDLGGKLTRMVRRRERMPRPDSATSAHGVPENVPRAIIAETVLAGRRSVRQFAERPVHPDLLVTALRAAVSSQTRQWGDGQPAAHGMELLVCVNAVEGLPPGLYTWRDEGRCEFLTSPPWLATLAGTYCAAPVIIMICGSLRHARPEAYGDVLVRAGALGYAIWLAARTHGLEGVTFGRSLDFPLVVPALTPGIRHIFTVALGFTETPDRRE